MRIPFMKLSGTGNDFILIDNRLGLLDPDKARDWVAQVCTRSLSVGADGLIFIVPSDQADFRWRFFNADGSEAEMCGNGSRCAARFAYLQGIAPARMSFETRAGIIQAEVLGERVKVRLPEPSGFRHGLEISLNGAPLEAAWVNTGVPHAVIFVENLEATDVVALGRQIRHHEMFQPAGTNANFVTVRGKHEMSIRTYERGVEGETLACGTGAVASAVVGATQAKVDSPVTLTARSGMALTVHFRQEGETFQNIFLEGDARIVYSGEMWEDAWQ